MSSICILVFEQHTPQIALYSTIINDALRDQICPGTQATILAYSFLEYFNVTKGVTLMQLVEPVKQNSVTIRCNIKSINDSSVKHQHFT